ncbi:ABC transporter permease [Paenibacillus sp. 481]|uniref:ABC transporter permease n=1 Tax=Paenibacillus sp. 481 TaxID=2835869 RepID=UPI001E3B62B3|nr:ABC transporter permease [Paenibacillus sp. 481]UHA74933.1 ABC transporter permease [Paenibacillus sp. 481]
MKGPYALVLHRYRQHAISEWKAVRSAIDWTVALYFVIPSLLLGIRFYWGWWNEPLPQAWLNVPVTLWLLPLLIPILFADLRTWSEAGDILFLRQKTKWWQTFVRFGCIECAVKQALIVMMTAVVLLPWLVRGYELNLLAISSLAGSVWISSCLAAVLRNAVHVCWSGWRRALLQLLIFVGLLAYGVGLCLLVEMPFILLGISMVVLYITMLLVRWRVRARYTFERDVKADYAKRMKLTGALLVSGQNIERPSSLRGSRPLLFRKSGYVMRCRTHAQRIGAIGVKALLRGGSNLMFYLQLTSVGVYASVMTGLKNEIIALIMLPVLCLIMGYWLSSYWKHFMEGELPAMFTFKPADIKGGAMHAALMLSWLPGALWAGAAGVVIAPVWAVPLFMVAGAGLAMLVSLTFASERVAMHKSIRNDN